MNLEEIFALLQPTSPANIAGAIINSAIGTLANPEIQDGLSKLVAGITAHSAVDVAQDALDACKNGQMSHEAALKIVAIALDDDMNRKQRRIN